MSSKSSHKGARSLEDLHLCKDAESVRQLFAKLGYAVESDLVPLPKADLALAPLDDAAIDRAFLLADQERQLQVLLFEPSVPLALHTRLRSLAQNFLKRGGNYLLVAVDARPYTRLTFVNPRRQTSDGAHLRVQIRKLVVDTRHPTRHDLDVLEACAANSQSPEQIYAAQCDAFNVERVTNQFYREYAVLFRALQEKIKAANRGVRQFSEKEFLHAFTQNLLGRLMFCYFLQKKGWLANDPQFLTTWYRHVVIGDEKLYYNDFLEKFFFETLNHRRKNDESAWGNIPYLNGGLFEREEELHDAVLFLPNELFDPQSDAGILGFFNNYNFTVEEDTPLEQEVALDPEMLGKVFENLLEEDERGKTGTFYTPRPIVHYMCREALLGYLQNVTKLDRALLQAQFDEEPEQALTVAQANAIEAALRALRVLDLAVGSGAFLVGMLHEMVTLRRACGRAKGEEVRRGSAAIAEWKREFIQNCLYGVDIKKEAIEIAKLRLWLSLVVDTERAQVEPLPNLDYKLMQGNSLIETLDGQPILAPELPQQRMTFDGQGVLPAMPTTQLTLGMSDTDQAVKVLHEQKEKYFTAEPHERAGLKNLIQQQETKIVLTHIGQRKADLETKIKGLVQMGAQHNWKGMAREQKQLERSYADLAKLAELEQNIRKGSSLPFFLFRLHFADVFERANGGFDVVIANPPYVRADSGEKHLAMRQAIEKSGMYETLWEKWDLYIPFIERGYKLLSPMGITTMIVSDAYCHSKYAQKSQDWFLRNSKVLRLDFLGRIKIFDAEVRNVIVFFERADGQRNEPERRVHDPEFGEVKLLPTAPQSQLTYRAFFPEESETKQFDSPTVAIGEICYVSFGCRPNSDEGEYRGEFVVADLLSTKMDKKHPKPYIEAKDVVRWTYLQTRWLEWGTERSPARLARPTFEALYEVPEKIVAADVSGAENRAAYDTEQVYHSHTLISFVPWHSLAGVRNNSIKKSTRYRDEKPPREDLPRREELEKASRRFAVKYLLAVMNSTAARDFLRANRRSNIHLYPDDWKKLPIPDVPREKQTPIVKLVDKILAAKRADVDADVSELEQAIDRLVNQLYGLAE